MEKKAQLFELGWGWYEDWSYYLFIHSDKTEQQFKEDVRFLLVKYGNEYLASEKSWAGASGWIEFIADKMPELGYKRTTPIRESFFGAYIIDKAGNEEEKEWGKIVGDELLEAAILHNKKLNEELD